MDENSVSLQIFLISVVFYYTWFRKPNFCAQATSKQYSDVCFVLGGAYAEAKIWFFSEKKNFIRHYALFNLSFLSLAFILKYYPILHVVKR